MGKESDDFFELASTAHNPGLLFPCYNTCEHLQEHSCRGGLIWGDVIKHLSSSVETFY